MIKNFYPIVKELKERIEKLTEYREVGDGVTEEEDAMFEIFEDCCACIDDYLRTEPQEKRKFEVGRCYLTDNLELVKITKKTEKSIYVKPINISGLGSERRFEYYPYRNDNESTSRRYLDA